MSEMVERVARAIWSATTPIKWDDASDDDYYDGPGRNTVRLAAHAAIEAMREPTDEQWDQYALEIWHAMIDAALGEK
jgi:hypothetical protein